MTIQIVLQSQNAQVQVNCASQQHRHLLHHRHARQILLEFIQIVDQRQNQQSFQRRRRHHRHSQSAHLATLEPRPIANNIRATSIFQLKKTI